MATKQLKLDHIQAQHVVQGTVTQTWRMYDDKDIRVHDVLDIVDKVNPADSATWKTVAQVLVTQVIEKPIRDINDNDYVDHQAHQSVSSLLRQFRGYYGGQINEDTPIKLISFQLQRNDVSDTTVKISEAKLFADGGSRGNPGPSASGYVLQDMNDNIVVNDATYLGITTNNQAEYQALKFGLEEAAKRNVRILHVFMDSLLVVNQMRGVFKVKNRDLWPVHESIKILIRQFEKVTFSHVPRELNKQADAAVNRILDETAAKQ